MASFGVAAGIHTYLDQCFDSLHFSIQRYKESMAGLRSETCCKSFFVARP